jgi:hypothetical protein
VFENNFVIDAANNHNMEGIVEEPVVEEAIADAPEEPNAPIPNADPDPMVNTLSALAQIPAMMRPFTSNTSLTQLEGIQNADEREAALLAAGNVYSYSESDAAIANSREVCSPTAIFPHDSITYHLIISQIIPFSITYCHTLSQIIPCSIKYHNVPSHTVTNHPMFYQIPSCTISYCHKSSHVTISHYILADPRAAAAHQRAPQHPLQDPMG